MGLMVAALMRVAVVEYVADMFEELYRNGISLQDQAEGAGSLALGDTGSVETFHLRTEDAVGPREEAGKLCDRNMTGPGNGSDKTWVLGSTDDRWKDTELVETFHVRREDAVGAREVTGKLCVRNMAGPGVGTPK